MQRAEFVAGVMSLGLGKLGRPSIPQHDMRFQQDTLDPAQTGQVQSLRVLLGTGDAQTVDDRSFVFEGRRFRGTFVKTDAGEIVNTVGLEEYLYSVVPREMPPSWPPAALQTQAIVARTFVLQRSSPSHAYDVVPSEADQVYSGMDSEHPQSGAAVDATAGQVLRYANAFALAMYSSCCGGHTEASSAAWGGKPLEYLGGVVCTYCRSAPWYKWTKAIDVQNVQNSLGAGIAQIGTIEHVTPDAPDASGRAHLWLFQGDAGEVHIPAANVRTALGTRVLPSLLVHRVSVTTQAPATLVIEGSGLGHGVGLCQWGARGMALAGAGARSILSYYYPGTGIGND